MLYQYFDLLFPSYCVSCGRSISIRDSGICSRCVDKIEYINEGCSRCCGQKVDGECRICGTRKIYYSVNRAIAEYSGVMKRCIRALKFSNGRAVAAFLGSLVCERLAGELSQYDVITCTPMNRGKKWTRGYNQAEIIARRVSKQSGVSFSVCLVENRGAGVQRNMSYNDRFYNILGRYRVKGHDVEGKNILLIDDVFTTGATINECARVLVEAGAGSVSAVTLARAVI